MALLQIINNNNNKKRSKEHWTNDSPQKLHNPVLDVDEQALAPERVFTGATDKATRKK